MIRKSAFIFITCLFLCLSLFGQRLNAAELTVEDIRFGLHADKNRLVIELNKPTDFRTFILTDPNRLVIDLPEFNWLPETIDNQPRSFVKGVRQGVLEPGLSRIVLDLDRKTEIATAFFLKAHSGRKDRLVIDYRTLTQAENLNKRFGSLSFASAAPKKPEASVQTPRTTSEFVDNTPIPTRKNIMRKKRIIIDAGHGGVDPGAIGKGSIREKHITLSIAKRVRDALEKTGRYDVILTRDDDRFIKLYARVAFARENRGDLFVSIHADSIGKKDVRGVSIYTLSNTASDAQTAKLAARENKADLIAGVDLSVEDPEVANILLDLVRRDTMNQSKFLANTLVSSFKSNGLRLLERPHRYAGFAVLKSPDIPSVLIESGFVSNPQEAKLLTRRDHQEDIAESIRHGIDQYFEKLSDNN